MPLKYYKKWFTGVLVVVAAMLVISCTHTPTYKKKQVSKTAEEILSNPDNLAICYGGYREKSRDIQPTIAEIKEDMKILAAMDIKLIRTYNVYLQETANLLEAITQLKQENPDFEMYLMLGAWIDCKDARTDKPDHFNESEQNAGEIDRAVALANKYPDIVKILAVGNEAMVKWAASYYVQPNIILKWVNYLQNLKKQGKLPATLWITSSDNFASWGGGGSEYHVEDLNQLILAVDFISMHTYPMHDTHYNPDFWGVRESETNLSDLEKIDAAMLRAKNYSIAQYENVVKYTKSIGVKKPIHIGESGWATQSNEHYGNSGSRATDEYKSALYYKHTREWTQKAGLICFYFEAFDEQWKDAQNPGGSENHFGLINLQAQAKYALWSLVDAGTFKGLTRNGKPITKTYKGNKTALIQDVKVPPSDLEIKELKKH
jgi:exo-beta-1,3-glucanase (GH17 family)